MKTNNIAIVNQHDQVIGYKSKEMVHAEGLLHRAFSILICNDRGQMLIHQRAHDKYHSPGLWTNACCSHLTEGEHMESVIYKRLLHEMGFQCPLSHQFTFHYRIDFDNGLTENEIDWVYIGLYNGNPNSNPEEVAAWKWVDIDWLINDMEQNPLNYTYWFRHIMNQYRHQIIDAFQKCRAA